MTKFAFVDVETTGLSPKSHRVIDIGIIIVKNHQIIAQYETLVNPQTSIPWFIQNHTGIKPQDVEHAPTFRQIHEQIWNLLEDTILVAHNATFDLGFIKAEFEKQKLEFRSDYLCTVKLSKNLYPQYRRHNLDSLISRFNLNVSRRHRALDDAHLIHEFYKIVNSSFPNNKIDDAIKTCIKSYSNR